jgi:hypothetical protein
VRSGTRWIPWLLFLTFVIVTGLATYAGMKIRPTKPITLLDALWAWSFAGFPFVGALVVRRLPRRPLGWILTIGPTFVMIGVFLSELAEAAFANGGPAGWMEWGANLFFTSGLVGILYVPLLLPDGRIGSTAMRRAVAGITLVVVLVAFVNVFAPGALAEFHGVSNPAGLEVLRPIAPFAAGVVGPLWLGLLMLGIVNLVMRFRRARGDERVQIRWIAMGAATVLLCYAAGLLIELFLADLSEGLGTVVVIFAILALPAAIGIAILRYRLYDIEVVVNRALVYTTLTTVLVAAYALGVLILRTVLDPLTGDNDLAIAASTLAVATLFGPARRRIQSFIDRRFYRSRYDAQQTLEQFAARLRDEVDLGALSNELFDVVARTFQPRHASIHVVRQGAP